MNSFKKRALAALLAGLLALPNAALTEGLPELGDASDAVLSEAKEREIGLQIMREVRRDPTYIEDAEVTDYVRSVGARLLSANNVQRDRGREIEFFVLQDDTINAFALVGGFIGVHTGLITLAQNESELAGVLAHEIGHVLQRHQARGLQEQGKANLASLAALAAAILASRGGSSQSGQVTEAAIATAQATQIQTYLNYTREFEREADRLGLNMLDKAGFEPRGMATFFEKLGKQARFIDPGERRLPGYLRTHPLTTERIADIQSRVDSIRATATQTALRSVTEDPDFHFVRAKLRALAGSPTEAIDLMKTTMADKGVRRERADVYGLALAYTRARRFDDANRELTTLRKSTAPHPMIENLAAAVQMETGLGDAAIATLKNAIARFPEQRAFTYSYANALLRLNRAPEALKYLSERLITVQDDTRLYELQAHAADKSGKRVLKHRMTAEVYARRGALPAAIDQLEQAIKLKDPDQFETASAEARLRELRREFEAEKEKKRSRVGSNLRHSEFSSVLVFGKHVEISD